MDIFGDYSSGLPILTTILLFGKATAFAVPNDRMLLFMVSVFPVGKENTYSEPMVLKPPRYPLPSLSQQLEKCVVNFFPFLPKTIKDFPPKLSP